MTVLDFETTLTRVLKDTAATISATWYGDGIPANAGTATYTVTRDNGDELVNGTAAGTATNPRTFTLTAEQTEALDLLAVTWDSPTLGTLTTQVEIVGGFLFSLAEARQMPQLAGTADFTAARLATARTLAEQALEDACGEAFVPRYRKQRLDGSGGCNLHLPVPRPLSVLSVSAGPASQNMTAYTDDQLARIEVYPEGILYNPAGWPCGRRNIEVAWVHGHAGPPLQRASRAAKRLVKNFLIENPVNDRAISVDTEGGSMQLLNPLGSGVTFGIPEVDAFVMDRLRDRVLLR